MFTTGLHQTAPTLPYRAGAYAYARGLAISALVFVVGLVVLRLAGDDMQLALIGGGLATVAVLAGAITASIYTDRRSRT